MNICCKINGQPIAWSFVQRVRRYCGGDWERCIDVFYKARNATDVVKYVAKGFRPDNPYSMVASPDFENDRQRVLSWWESVCVHKKVRRPDRMKTGKALLKAFVDGLED